MQVRYRRYRTVDDSVDDDDDDDDAELPNSGRSRPSSGASTPITGVFSLTVAYLSQKIT